MILGKVTRNSERAVGRLLAVFPATEGISSSVLKGSLGSTSRCPLLIVILVQRMLETLPGEGKGEI